MTQRRKILVIGSGGREHALALKLLASESVETVAVMPGNAGTAQPPPALAHKVLKNVAGTPLDIARAENIDLVVVGPEAPLCEGLVDRLTEAGFVAFGPSRSAARLEGSKSFMKEFAAKYGIPTAGYRVVRSTAELDDAMRSFERPPVVKADGLCGGKGVVVGSSKEEAVSAARAMLSGERFGDAGRVVVLEERIEGQEASIHAICDGERFVMLPSAQDHKRIGEGDTGPNTGGMGTYAPAPLVSEGLARRVGSEMIERCLAGMRSEGIAYRGALFAGLMIRPDGEPCLLEYNVRFGDPETQVLMSVLDGDLAEALLGAARGTIPSAAVHVTDDHALCVVLAAAGYPDVPRTGDTISGLEEAAKMEGVTVYHAGTRREGQRVVTAGGRVLGVTARAASLDEARRRAYAAADAIEFSGKQARRDVGARALGAK